MLEMATNNPCALPNSNPCGCWRWRRTVRETPVLADAGDGDEKSVRFVELQSLRMLETTKDGPCNSGPRGCWRWRGTIHTPCRTPLLAALEIAKTRSCNSTPCGCWRWRRAVRAKSHQPAATAGAATSTSRSCRLPCLRPLLHLINCLTEEPLTFAKKS